MSIKYIGVLYLFLTTELCCAEDGKLQAQTFSNLYSSVCLKNIHDLGKLKAQLKGETQMPAEDTRKLLRGAEGNAWIVPDDSGAFILALQEKSRICTVIAHHADAKSVEEAFLKLVNSPIAPLETKKINDKFDKTTANGKAHTSTYEWQAHNGKHKLVFVLSTSTFEKAEMQAIGSISIVTEGQ
ncbi:MAG TPA: hypothetical protein VIZ65_04990 [Cellvibrionaceae bacterium]